MRVNQVVNLLILILLFTIGEVCPNSFLAPVGFSEISGSIFDELWTDDFPRLVLREKEARLKRILAARGYLELDSERKLNAAINLELKDFEKIFGKRLIKIEMAKTPYTSMNVARKMPFPDDVRANTEIPVNTFEGEKLIAEARVSARISFAQFIRWILWEKGFHGKDKSESFDTYGIGQEIGTNVFKEGPLVDLIPYLKIIIRAKLVRKLGNDSGALVDMTVLPETERALKMISEWFLEHDQGTDFGVELLSLKGGLSKREIMNYDQAIRYTAALNPNSVSFPDASFARTIWSSL